MITFIFHWEKIFKEIFTPNIRVFDNNRYFLAWIATRESEISSEEWPERLEEAHSWLGREHLCFSESFTSSMVSAATNWWRDSGTNTQSGVYTAMPRSPSMLMSRPLTGDASTKVALGSCHWRRSRLSYELWRSWGRKRMNSPQKRYKTGQDFAGRYRIETSDVAWENMATSIVSPARRAYWTRGINAEGCPLREIIPRFQTSIGRQMFPFIWMVLASLTRATPRVSSKRVFVCWFDLFGRPWACTMIALILKLS